MCVDTFVRFDKTKASRQLSKQLLLFVFARRHVCQYSMAEETPAAHRQTAVTAYLKSKQLLFVFAWQCYGMSHIQIHQYLVRSGDTIAMPDSSNLSSQPIALFPTPFFVLCNPRTTFYFLCHFYGVLYLQFRKSQFSS